MEDLEEESFFGFQTTEMATRLRNELDNRMASDDQSQVSGCNAPVGISHMVHYIMGEFSHRKTKAGSSGQPKTAAYLRSQRKYRQFFRPGQIKFTFPSEASTKLPSPHYHALQNTSYIHVDWEMSHPEATLFCYECNKNEDLVKLAHDRTNFTKGRNLFPIFDQGGSVIWASVMVYCCPKCEARYPGNDGRLLQMLDPQVRHAYPVHPRYALEGATWHLTKELADDLDDSMLTYGNGDYFSRKLYNRKWRAYEERLENYFCSALVHHEQDKHEDYIPIRDWIGEFPPSGEALRTLYEKAERSSLNQTGISNYQRNKLEIQSVGCSQVFSIDWTFAVVKNYTLPGAKACFTSMVETGEVCSLGLVSTTKVEEVAHMVEQTRRRPNFKPQAIFTDTWPHNNDFWFMIFGTITGCLGIFHFMKRMVDTLRPNHHKYWEAMISLKDAIYTYEREDYRNLLNSLKTGTMAKDKKRYSDQEIWELRHSKKWKQRYAKYLRKRLNAPDDIRQRLLKWRTEYANRVDPASGKKLFTADTKSAVENQMEHVEHIQFPKDMEMYRAIPPGLRSTHKLPCYRSINPEPMLESWHGRFAHFGNTGMRAGLADCLHLKGAAEGNVVVRHKLRMLNEDSTYTLTDELNPPGGNLRDRPVLKDHCLGKYLNDLAAKAGCKLPYRNLRPVGVDNGEVFMSEYYEQQQKRNQDARDRPDTKTKRCCCKRCGRNQVLLINEVLEAREILVDMDADEVVTEIQELNETTGASHTLTLAVTKAQYIIAPGLNVASPITPITPYLPIDLATGTPLALAGAPTAVQFADNEICCLPFLQYKFRESFTGKCRPGPRPHATNCRNYRVRRKPKGKTSK
jgi:hypothetical protein